MKKKKGKENQRKPQIKATHNTINYKFFLFCKTTVVSSSKKSRSCSESIC
jgi:hypothetical protein